MQCYLEQLYPQQDGHTESNVDVIFVPGLNPKGSIDHARKTWTCQSGEFWPEILLPDFVPSARILLYGYNSSAALNVSGDTFRYHALQLLDRLLTKRRHLPNASRPLLFICHSLGGLVVKLALILAEQKREIYGSIRTATKGLIFFATPHNGEGGKNIAIPAANIFSLLTGLPQNDLRDKLAKDSLFRRELTENFTPQQDEYEVRTFCEREVSNIKVRVWKKIVPQYSSMLVVNHTSATYGDPLRCYPIPISDDHSNICRFSSLGDAQLFTVKNNIEELVHKVIDHNPSTTLGYRIPTLPPPTPTPVTKVGNFLEIGDSRTTGTAQQKSVDVVLEQGSPLTKNLVPRIKTSHFIGRESALSELEVHFDASDQQVCRAVIWGMGGVGKSQFALEFCKRRYEKFEYSVFWVEARSLETLKNSYRYIAGQLRLDCNDPVTSVTAWFRKSSRILVVFDNVDSLDIVQEYLPPPEINVIITTRDSALVGSETFPFGLEVPLLDDDEAISLFILSLSPWGQAEAVNIRRNSRDVFSLAPVSRVLADKFNLTSPSELTQVLALTDRLPLAIVQCASYLRQYPMPFSLYLDKFNTKAPEALRRIYSHSIKGGIYHESVMTTWDISMDRLSTNALRMITFFGFLSQTQIMMPFLEHALDDCRFWGGRVCTPLPNYLREFFAFLNTQDEFYESIGLLDSLSLVKRDTSKLQIYIHPMMHEYIHLRMPWTEATTWLDHVTALLRHHLPPLLYSTHLDKHAAQRSEQVFEHLGRNADLVEKYRTRVTQQTANNSAAFFLEAYLWYRGRRYLDLSEKLMADPGHPWDFEMLYGIRLLSMISEYQANPGRGLDATAFDTYVEKIKKLPREGRQRPPGSKMTLCQAAFSHRWIDTLLSNRLVSSELKLALSKMPWFSWQLVNPDLSQTEVDHIAVAVFAQARAKAVMAINDQSQQPPGALAVDLLWQTREKSLLGLECECSELDLVFDDLLKFQASLSSKVRGVESLKLLLRVISFYHEKSTYLHRYLDRRWNDVEIALITCTKDAQLEVVSELPSFMLEDEYYVNRILNSSNLRKLIFPSLPDEEVWLKGRIRRLEKQLRSEKQMLLLRRVKARLAEILLTTGPDGVKEANTIIKDIFVNLVDPNAAPDIDLVSFGERLLKPVLSAEAFHADAGFYQQVTAVLLSLKTERTDALVRHWVSNLYSMLEKANPKTVLPLVCKVVIPYWDYENRRSTQHDKHTMDILDRFGFYIITLPGSRDLWPITSLRAYHLSGNICKELQAKGNLNFKRLREWVAKIDDFDGLFGKFGSWRDMPITARDINEITLAGIKLQRCAPTEKSVQHELLIRSYDNSLLKKIFRKPLSRITALPPVDEPSFVRLPLGIVIGTTTEIIASSYHGPRCGIWVAKETESARAILFWTRPDQSGVFYIDITPKVILHRFFNSWLHLDHYREPQPLGYCLFQLHFIPYGDWRFVSTGRRILDQYRVAGGTIEDHDYPTGFCRYSWEEDAISIPILDDPLLPSSDRTPSSPPASATVQALSATNDSNIQAPLNKQPISNAETNLQAPRADYIQDASVFTGKPEGSHFSSATETVKAPDNPLNDESSTQSMARRPIDASQYEAHSPHGFIDGSMYKSDGMSTEAIEQPRTFTDLNNTWTKYLNFKEGDKYKAGDEIVKIAIFDTGFDRTHEDMAYPRAVAFKDGQPVHATSGEQRQIDRIAKWKDFCSEGNSTDLRTMEDLDGHGTQVAGIILRLAPKAQLFIARICHGEVNQGLVPTDPAWLRRDRGEYIMDPTADNVVKAVEWAIAEGVHIINMSLGFRKPNRMLENALAAARDRRILVFAAMANEGIREKAAWPARDSTDAIGIHSCRAYGKTSSEFTPMPVANNMNFMVVGESIVVHLTKRKGGGFCYAKGTSYATPVAVSKAAIILAFVNQTQADCKRAREKSEETVDVNRIWTNEGMIKVLEKCSDEALEGSRQDRYRWIDPRLLWKPSEEDEDEDEISPVEYGWRTIRRSLKK